MSNATPRHNVNVIIPRAARIPSGFDMLAASAALQVAPAVYESAVIRQAHISSLISSALQAR